MTLSTIIMSNTVCHRGTDYLTQTGIRLMKEYYEKEIVKEREKKAKAYLTLSLEEMEMWREKTKQVIETALIVAEVMENAEDSITRKVIAENQ